MYWTGYAVDGLYLQPGELAMLRTGYEAEHGDVSDEEWDELILNERELKLGGSTIYIVPVTDDNCEGLTLYPYGSHRGPIDLVTDCVVIEANYQPSPFSVAYPSVEAMKREFTAKLGQYLPADFDWEHRMGHFQYACFA